MTVLRPLLLCVAAIVSMTAADATFVRAVNLNGPALTIDERSWEGKDAANVKVEGKAFANQSVALKPATDTARAQMIRSSRWGSKVDVELGGLPAGQFQIFLYVWEDNHSERFDLLVNGAVVQEGFVSGATGAWKRLGPWSTVTKDGKVTVSARAPDHGAANLSGIEVWTAGTVPAAPLAAFADTPTSDQVEFFEKRIRPVLVEHCYDCHSAGAKKINGGLVLDSRAGVRTGGDTGAIITAGDPDASMLIQAIRHLDEDTAMPPKEKLSPAIIADLEQWVRMGAPDPRSDDTLAAVQEKEAIDWNAARQWWSFRPLTAPMVPSVQDVTWASSDLDHFVLAKVEQSGLKPAADSDKRALIRRATYDLTGLPPTPAEVDAFLADTRAEAFADIIDRLLASPRYGERWGRHWLDVVRYADSAGDNSDFPIPQMRRYRDWVIDAFNRDMPYDRFVREQLAGDLLGGEGDERFARVTATGYLANARRFGSRVGDYPWHLTIEDTIDNLGRAFLGLSVSCARCHDHKFDPITQRDYYALYGIFNSTRYPWPGIELDQNQRDMFPLVPNDQMASAFAAITERGAAQKKLDQAVKDLKAEQKKVEEEARKAVKERLTEALKTAAEAGRKEIEERFKAEEKQAGDEAKKSFDERLKTAEKSAADHQSMPLPFALAYAVTDAAKREDAVVQHKGDPAKPGERVRRHFLSVFGGAELPSTDRSSGRQALAEWIFTDGGALSARVIANRVWHYHFGRGLVPTPNDFGKQGKPPTHPELLDHLALRLKNLGWSLKALHREIILSRTYQQSSALSDEALAKDPTNELLSAFPRRRLDAESLRDTLLAIGGNLDLTPAGDHPFPPASERKFTQHNPFKAEYETERRSVYLMTQRIQRHSYLAVFDGADPSTSTPVRPTSTTPLQALFLLNDRLVHAQAQRVAERISGADPTARVDALYRTLFARPANKTETTAALNFLDGTRTRLKAAGASNDRLESDTWSSLVRVLFRLNEFVYLD
ncbi:MAG: DUF1553 domain-containing protein [Planctomycetes bacterium]|nr:DUF1553 domain-containing protein [Planctomycetota bacterium]